MRQLIRDFNQSLVIAEGINHQWNLNLEDKMLKREKYTQTQVRLSVI